MSTRRVDDLVIALGGTVISKSEVSRICSKLDAEVVAWRSRPLDEQAFPYVFLDATYGKVRINQRVVPQGVVIATGVSADGNRKSSAAMPTASPTSTTSAAAYGSPAPGANAGLPPAEGHAPLPVRRAGLVGRDLSSRARVAGAEPC